MVCGVKFDHDKLLKLHMEHYHKLGEKGNKKDLLAFCQELSVNIMKRPVNEEYLPWANGSTSKGEESKTFEHFSRESGESHPKIDMYEKEQNSDKQFSPNPLSAASNYMEHGSSGESERGSEYSMRRFESSVMSVSDIETRDEKLARCRTQSYEGKVGCGFPQRAEDRGQLSGSVEGQGYYYNSHDVRTFLGGMKKETDRECVYFEHSPTSGYDEKHQIEKAEVATSQFDSHHGFDNPGEQNDKCEAQAQIYRPSVITSNCSPFRRSPQRAEEYMYEKHQGRESVADSDRGSEQAESCPGTDDDAFDSSGESDSSSVGDTKLFTKRGIPRCNRCQQTFASKMEYLHHLIAHQRGDQMKIRYPQFDEQEKNRVKTFLHELRGPRVYNSIQDSHELMAETAENPLSQLHNLSLMDSPTRPQKLPFSESSSQSNGRRHCIPAEKDPQYPDEIYPKNLPHGRVACSECNEVFTDAVSCRVHIERHHSRLRCKECGLKFDHRKLLRIHIESYHSSKEMLKCYQCGQSFDERSQFVSHVTLHQEELRNKEEDWEKQDQRQSKTNANTSPEREEKPCYASGRAGVSRHNSENESEQKPTAEELLEYSRQTQSKSAGKHVHSINPVTQATSLPRDDPLESDYEMKESEGMKTRIFIPKFEANQQLLPGTDFNPMHFYWRAPADGRSYAPFKKPLKRTRSAPPETSKRVSTIVSTMDSTTVTPGEVTGTPRELIGSPYMMALQNSMIKRIKQEFDERSDNILHGPPPLIPIHRRKSQPEVEAANRPQDNQFLNTPTRVPDMQLQTSKPPIGAPRQKTKLARSFSAPHRDTRIRESIQTATKEALLNTLSLKRRVALLEQNNLLRKQQEGAAHTNAHVNTTGTARENTPMQHSQASVNHAADIFREKEFSQFQAGQRNINKNFDCHHCGLHFDHKKLLKIHLDAYHGSATRMSCDRCDLKFIDRDQFLNHLMSHPEDEQGFQPRYNRPYVRRKSKPLANGEAVVSRELNPVMKCAEEPESEKKVEALPVDQRDQRVQHIQQDRAHIPSTETVVIPGLRTAGDSMVLREYHVPGVISQEQPFKKGKFKQNPGDQSKECFVCGKVFDSGRRLEVHISSHASLDKDGRYCCSLCSKTFDHHRKLEIHTRSHTGFKPHKCDLCGRCFPYYSSFYYHKMTHTKDKPHKCPLCGKGFIQTRYLRTHLRTHKDWQGNSSGEENIASPSTPLSESYESTDSPTDSPSMCFQNSEQADGNAFETDENDLEQSTAEILCSFKANSRRRESLLSSESSPDNHRIPSPTRDYAQQNEKQDFANENITDESANIFECCVCNKKCETAEELQAHSQTHQTEKPYRCKQCNKSFSAYSSLYVHNRIHTGQRPYSCRYCGKKFTHASGLKRHVRCHTGERPYPCPLCPSAFADRGALRSHIRTHTGERPYKCNWCGKTYTQPSSLKVHKRTLHVEEEMKAKSAKMKK